MLFALPHWLLVACVVTVGIYGLCAFPHLFIEHWYAWRHYRQLENRKRRALQARMAALEAGQRRVIRVHKRVWYAWLLPGYDKRRVREINQAKERLELSRNPHVIKVWVTVYQEEPGLLDECLRSLAIQDYRGVFEVIVVDDASYLAQIDKYSAPQPPEVSYRERFALVLRRRKPVRFLWRKPENYAERLAYYVEKRAELVAVLRRYNWQPRFRVFMPTTNAGKREAQQRAWLASWQEDDKEVLYGSVDSDTVVDPDAFTLLAENFANPDIGAATGFVDVRNADVNLLTRLIRMRYWNAFHVERAAQSYHQAVMCCSGPLALYRASVVDQVMGQYVTQRFLDQFCTFGDDRHLTNLVLRKGYLVVMDPRAICYTQVPTTISGYLRQQTRWNKSFYREMLWTTGAIWTHSWYMTYDLICQALLPFLLVFSLTATVLLALSGGGWPVMVLYLLTVLVIGLLRSLYGLIVTRDAWFLLFSTYGLIYVTILLPVRFRALWTLRRTHWGTRIA